MPVQKIPEGFNSVTPTLVVNNAARAIELYGAAFGAKETYRMADPKTGKIMHACIQVGSSKVFLCDVNPDMGCANPTSSNFYLYIEDVDTTFRQAVQAGLKEASPVQDMFWGDRVGSVKDPFGNSWTLATHVRDVSPQEMEEARKKMSAKAA
jgi:PhnB protein